MGSGMYPRRDIPKWSAGLKDAENILLMPQGGVENRAGTLTTGGFGVGENGYPPRLIPFEASEDDTYMLELGDFEMRILKNGSYVLDDDEDTYQRTGFVLTEENPARISFVATDPSIASEYIFNTLLYVSDPTGTSPLHGAVIRKTASGSGYIEFEVAEGVTVDNSDGSWNGLTAGASLSAVYQAYSSFPIEILHELQYAQDVDTMVFSHADWEPTTLVRASDTDWFFAALPLSPGLDAPANVYATQEVGTGSTAYQYVVSAVSGENGEEGLPSAMNAAANDLTTAGNSNVITWDAVDGATYYRVYKEFNGIYGYIGITQAETFIDENITPNTADNPQTERDPFASATDWPSAVGFIDQRLTFAATANNPQVVEMSTSTTPFNFNRALTPGASDAVSFRMRAQKLNRVYHILDADRPIILTAGAEWYMQTENDAGVAPGNFSLRPKTFRGSAQFPPPVLIGETVLHVTRDGNTLREFSLDVSRDNASADVTVLARHLFRGKTIASMAYAQSPNSVLWVTMTDGSLYTMTYIEEHEIWGWTKQVLGGTDVFVHQVATVTEGAYDTPYFVVSRTLQGQTTTRVERLDDRSFSDVEDAYFVDCGVRYDGDPATVIGGLPHLAGEEVTALADGNVIAGLTVADNGTITLPAASSKVSVGLPYEAFMVTLGEDFGDQIEGLGSGLGRFSAPTEVAVKVVDTRGISAGVEGGYLNEVKEFTGANPIPLVTTTHLVTIEGDWDMDVSIEVRQAYPLPMTVTAIAPEWELGE